MTDEELSAETERPAHWEAQGQGVNLCPLRDDGGEHHMGGWAPTLHEAINDERRTTFRSECSGCGAYKEKVETFPDAVFAAMQKEVIDAHLASGKGGEPPKLEFALGPNGPYNVYKREDYVKMVDANVAEAIDRGRMDRIAESIREQSDPDETAVVRAVRAVLLTARINLEGTDEGDRMQRALDAFDHEQAVTPPLTPDSPGWEKADAEATIANLRATLSEQSQILFAAVKVLGKIEIPGKVFRELSGSDQIDRDDGPEIMTLTYLPAAAPTVPA